MLPALCVRARQVYYLTDLFAPEDLGVPIPTEFVKVSDGGAWLPAAADMVRRDLDAGVRVLLVCPTGDVYAAALAAYVYQAYIEPTPTPTSDLSRGVEWVARKRPAVTAAALRKRGLFEQRLSPKRPPSSSPPPLGAKTPTASDSPPLPAATATTTSSSSSSSLTAQAGCNPNNASPKRLRPSPPLPPSAFSLSDPPRGRLTSSTDHLEDWDSSEETGGDSGPPSPTPLLTPPAQGKEGGGDFPEWPR